MTQKDTIKVLIVDDEDRFRATTGALLRKRGFEVSDAPGGSAAIELIKKTDIDVVILDVRMPGMDGNIALREIKKIKPEAQVIMLTGYGAPDSALPSLRDGVFDYLSKPCDIEVLADKIRAAYVKEKGISEEPPLKDIMMPLSLYNTIHEDRPISEVIELIRHAYLESKTAKTKREIVHPCVLVMDKNDKIVGLLTLNNLLYGLKPPVLRLIGGGVSADSISVKPLSYSGLFTLMVRELGLKKANELMSEAPPKIVADANLMDVVNKLIAEKVQRLLIEENGKVVGVVCEQDIFFQMANVLSPHNT